MSVYPYIWRLASLYPKASCSASYQLLFSHPLNSSKYKSPGGVGWAHPTMEMSVNTHKAVKRDTTGVKERLIWRSMSESQD